MERPVCYSNWGIATLFCSELCRHYPFKKKKTLSTLQFVMCPVDLILPTAAGCRAPAVAAGSPHRTVAVDFSVACCLCPLAPLGSFSRLHYLRRCQVIPLPHTSICESSHGFMISCKVQLACRLRMHKLGHPSMSLSRQGPYLTSLCPEGASASNATTSSESSPHPGPGGAIPANC
jgi:hypothetical protein